MRVPDFLSLWMAENVKSGFILGNICGSKKWFLQGLRFSGVL